MKYLYPLLLAVAVMPAAATAQNIPLPELPLSSVQPGRLYVGASLGIPVYWHEFLFQQDPVQGGAYRLEGCLSLVAGKQFTKHWAAQAGISGYFLPAATKQEQYYATPLVVYSSYRHFGATAVAVPLQLRYNPRWNLGRDGSLEGWLGATPVWQRVQGDFQSSENGQLTYDTHVNTQATDLYATAGASLLKGVGPGLEVMLDLGLAQRLRLQGSARAAPGLAVLFGGSVRYQLGGRPHRLRYRTD